MALKPGPRWQYTGTPPPPLSTSSRFHTSSSTFAHTRYFNIVLVKLRITPPPPLPRSADGTFLHHASACPSPPPPSPVRAVARSGRSGQPNPGIDPVCRPSCPPPPQIPSSPPPAPSPSRLGAAGQPFCVASCAIHPAPPPPPSPPRGRCN